MTLPIHIALSAVGGTLFEADAAPLEIRVVTDTRTLQPGETFLALRGENFNGHDFVGEAVAKGAALCIVDEPHVRVPGAATIMVERTNLAYLSLARAARERFHGRVVAITGSSGKTTTKALLAQLLALRYGTRVAATPANENNEIGVSRLLLNASDAEHDVLVAELGARHFGDIATLVDVVRPEIGVLTNVGDAHLEIMGSRERLEETKWGLFARGARAVLNAYDVASLARAERLADVPHWFAACDASAVPATPGRTTALVGATRLLEVALDGTRERAVDVRLPGLHNRANLAAAIAAADELDVSLEALVRELPNLRLPEGRFESLQLPGRARLIYDAYNANASGMLAALDAFAREPGARHIAVLGSMAELGDEAMTLHERVGAHAAGCVDMLLVGGEFADALARGARGAGLSPERVTCVADNGAASAWLRDNTVADDVVLLKASRKYRFEEIVAGFRT